MNDTTSTFAIPPGAVQTVPRSPGFIEFLRRSAAQAPWPRSWLLSLRAEICEADRQAHEAICRKEQAALDRAILARCCAAGRMEDAKRQITETFLSMLSIAAELQLDSILGILQLVCVNSDIRELSDAVVALQARQGVRR